MKNLLKRSISAGVVISLGGYAYIKTYQDNHYIAAFLFSLGLLTVLYLQYDLFTGKVCNIVSNISQSYTVHNKQPTYNANNILYYIIVLIGNAVGCLIMALITVQTNINGYDICALRVSKSPLNLFCAAIICEICISIAVWVFNNNKDKNTNIVVVLAVMVFILSGAEHCIADIYYVLVDVLDGKPSINPIIGLEIIMIVIMGNLIGGMAMNLICKCKENK